MDRPDSQIEIAAFVVLGVNKRTPEARSVPVRCGANNRFHQAAVLGARRRAGRAPRVGPWRRVSRRDVRSKSRSPRRQARHRSRAVRHAKPGAVAVSHPTNRRDARYHYGGYSEPGRNLTSTSTVQYRAISVLAIPAERHRDNQWRSQSKRQLIAAWHRRSRQRATRGHATRDQCATRILLYFRATVGAKFGPRSPRATGAPRGASERYSAPTQGSQPACCAGPCSWANRRARAGFPRQSPDPHPEPDASTIQAEPSAERRSGSALRGPASGKRHRHGGSLCPAESPWR